MDQLESGINFFKLNSRGLDCIWSEYARLLGFAWIDLYYYLYSRVGFVVSPSEDNFGFFFFGFLFAKVQFWIFDFYLNFGGVIFMEKFYSMSN